MLSGFSWLRCLALSLFIGGAFCEDAMAHSLFVRGETYRSFKGFLRCSLFSQPSGFPGDSSKAYEMLSVAVDSPKAGCLFKGLKPGSYAVAMMHDENSNEKMDTSIVGMPIEGWAVTNDAGPSMFGPPSYEDAKIELTAKPQQIVLKLRY
jgi:uncharacterized protein (DUF2141 family)